MNNQEELKELIKGYSFNSRSVGDVIVRLDNVNDCIEEIFNTRPQEPEHETVDKLKGIKYPVRYNEYGQMIFDADGTLILEVRGWGYFQKLKEGAKLQDDLGKFIVNALNGKPKGE